MSLHLFLRTSTLALAATFAVVALSAGACGGKGSDDKTELGGENPHNELSPEARAALEAGNNALREGKLDEALTLYRTASAAAPMNAAAHYGIYMVAQRMGNSALADTAMRNVQALSSAPDELLADSGAHKALVPPPNPQSFH